MADILNLSFGCGNTLLASQLNIMADAIRSLITLVGTIGDQVGNYIPLSGSEDISGVLAPDTNEGYDLGKSNKRWGTVWASVGGFKVIDFYDLQSPYGKLGRLEINQDGKLQYDGEPLALLSDINNEVNNDNQSFIHFGQNVRGRLDENYVRIPTSLKLDDVDDNEEAISNNYYNLYCGGINIKGTKFIQRGNYRFEEDDGEEHHTLCVRDGELLFDGNPIGSNPQLGNVLEGINELDLPESSKYLYYNYNNLSFEWANGTGGGVSYDSTDDRGKYLKVKDDGTGTEWVFASPGGGGVSSLNDLSGVSIDSSSEGQVLYYDGEKWTNSFISPNELPSYLKAGLNDYLKIGTGRIPEWAPDTMVHYLVNNNVVTDSVNIGNGVKDDTSSGTLGANQILARNFVTTRKLTILERDFTNNTSSNESFITIGTYGTVENNDQRKYILIDGSNVAGVDFKLSTNGQLCVNGNPIVFSQGTPTANLPNTSTDNDGQYLTVENGIAKWVSVTPGSGLLWSDLTNNNTANIIHSGNLPKASSSALGIVKGDGLTVSINSSGEISVSGTLAGLNVESGIPSNGDILVYRTSSNEWKKESLPTGNLPSGGINGDHLIMGNNGPEWETSYNIYLVENGNKTLNGTITPQSTSSGGGIFIGTNKSGSIYSSLANPILLSPGTGGVDILGTSNVSYKGNLKVDTNGNFVISSPIDCILQSNNSGYIYLNSSKIYLSTDNNSNNSGHWLSVDSNGKLNYDGAVIGGGSSSYTLPAATDSALGGIKIGYAQNNKNYPVLLDTNNKAYVNVPWTASNLTLSGLIGSSSIGGQTTPIYWNGSAFSTCNTSTGGGGVTTIQVEGDLLIKNSADSTYLSVTSLTGSTIYLKASGITKLAEALNYLDDISIIKKYASNGDYNFIVSSKLKTVSSNSYIYLNENITTGSNNDTYLFKKPVIYIDSNWKLHLAIYGDSDYWGFPSESDTDDISNFKRRNDGRQLTSINSINSHIGQLLSLTIKPRLTALDNTHTYSVDDTSLGALTTQFASTYANINTIKFI